MRHDDEFASHEIPGASAMTEMFRLGVVGAGRMGRTHLAALASSQRVKVVAVAETMETTREELTAEGYAVCAELRDLLRRGDLDGILIATPSDHHLDVVAQAAAAGIPILCEKPCGITSAQALRAAELAAERSVPLQVAYWRRFVPELQHLKARISSGAFGEIYFVACYQWDEQPPSAAFRARSGGIFVDMAVHEFDQMQWLTGQKLSQISVVRAQTSADPTAEGDPDSAAALCTLDHGATGLVSLGRRHIHGDICRVEVFGTLDAAESRFLAPPNGTAVFMEALKLQAEGFAAWVRGGAPAGASAEDAVAALQAVERAAEGG
jgi:myo-inositol 2-dehydrogenase/D-chiro-inositol 1-dehydrogenase